MNEALLIETIQADKLNSLFSEMKKEPLSEKERYLSLIRSAIEKYGTGDYHLISSPGRSEIGGNHTDHQHGHVIAAALNLDNLCIAKKRDDNLVIFEDSHLGKFSMDLTDLSYQEKEKNTSASLVRGMASILNENGYRIGGFEALCDSQVLIGSGISSSACFEVMLAEIFNSLYNQGALTPVQKAIYAQYAENVYFGKPCGLMDQLSIACGGFSAIDFLDPKDPVIENFDFSFKDHGYDFILVDTKGDHSGLSNEYAAITEEIAMVAKELGVSVLRDGDKGYFFSHLSQIRQAVGNDRAILRSIHFFEEDERAVLQKEAIRIKDINTLLNLMKESGSSSFRFLQNVYPSSRPLSQSISLGLAVSERVLKGKGACRVHGGGFEGTIQAIVPCEMTKDYQKIISDLFGEDSLMICQVRPFGTKTLL